LKSTFWFVFSAVDDSKPEGQIKEGITSVDWISRDELPGIINNTWDSIKDVLSDFIIKNP
jgi:hypothetical protein